MNLNRFSRCVVVFQTQVGVQEHSDNPVTSSTEVLVNVDSCKTEISAEITVHASETVVRTPNTEEQNESPPEVPIYAVRGNRTPDDSEDSDHEPSLFVVGSQRSHSQQFHSKSHVFLWYFLKNGVPFS